MSALVREEPIGRLGEHGQIPVAVLVERVLDVSILDNGLGGIVLNDVVVDVPWEKNHDAIEGQGPTSWPERFDTSNWGLLAAYENETRVGGAVIAFRTPELYMLEGRDDLAALWDLRVSPDRRSHGIGSQLFRAVEEWTRKRGCRMLKIETQNINVPACRFYARLGCTLGGMNRFAYKDLPEETQLLWFKEL